MEKECQSSVDLLLTVRPSVDRNPETNTKE